MWQSGAEAAAEAAAEGEVTAATAAELAQVPLRWLFPRPPAEDDSAPRSSSSDEGRGPLARALRAQAATAAAACTTVDLARQAEAEGDAGAPLVLLERRFVQRVAAVSVDTSKRHPPLPPPESSVAPQADHRAQYRSQWAARLQRLTQSSASVVPPATTVQPQRSEPVATSYVDERRKAAVVAAVVEEEEEEEEAAELALPQSEQRSTPVSAAAAADTVCVTAMVVAEG